MEVLSLSMGLLLVVLCINNECNRRISKSTGIGGIIWSTWLGLIGFFNIVIALAKIM